MKEKLLKWVGITIAIGIAVFFIDGFVSEYKLGNNHHFTIAITKGYGGGGFVEFEFKVNGVTYKGSNKGMQLKPNGAKYFVKFYQNDPSLIAKIASSEEVPECIGDPPSDGWKEIPKCK